MAALLFLSSSPYKRRTGLHHLLSLNLNIFESSFFVFHSPVKWRAEKSSILPSVNFGILSFCLSDELRNLSVISPFFPFLSSSSSLIKHKEMTLFSLHHASNFPGLVPPALWRDPGHRAAGGRGKTERVAHPGKTDAHCGVIVLLALRTYALLTIPSGGGKKRGCRKHRPVCTWTVRVWIPVSGSCPRSTTFTLMCSGLFLYFPLTAANLAPLI